MFKIIIFLFLFTCIVIGQEPNDREQNYEQAKTEVAKRQEQFERLLELSNTVVSLATSKIEKEQSWEKLTIELETEKYSKQEKTVALQNIVLVAPEPFRGKAWLKIKQLGLTTYSSSCDVFKYVILNVPEPYKEYAWNELGKCSLDDFNGMYSSLVIENIEPYSLWAWQKLESFWSFNENRDQGKINETLLQVVLYANEPYQRWAWDKISADQSDITILYKLLTEWPYPEPYAAMSWAIISNLKFEEIAKQEVNLLKTIANRSFRMRYRMASLLKLLTLDIPAEEKKIANEMCIQFSFALEKEERGEGYAIAHHIFEIKKENENK